MTTMLIPDPHATLTAIADHITTHPHLAHTCANVQPNRGLAQLYPVNWDRTAPNLGVLADWALTMYDVAPAAVAVAPNGTRGGHLILRALVHDGTAMSLVVVLDVHEGQLLAANLPGEMRVGVEVPVALLLRLVDANAAEQLAAERGVVVERVPDQVGDVVMVTEPAEDTTP